MAMEEITKEEFPEKQSGIALSEEELAQVTGGDIEITPELIKQYINEGKDRNAAEYFSLVQYSLAPQDAYDIRVAFLEKFGYPIDMYAG